MEPAQAREVPGVIYSGEYAAQCTRAYCSFWGVPHLPQRNPCVQPVSLERRHIPILLNENYVVSDKSDGVRYALFLCKENGQHFSFLVDRKLALYQIPVAACSRAFAGSVFDGELIWAQSSQGKRLQLFLIFDVIAINGLLDIQHQNLHRRLELIRGTFDLSGEKATSPTYAAQLAKRGKIICGGNAHGLSFRPKQCFPMDQLDTLLRQIPSLPYATDGLIFTPVDAPVCTGTGERIFKLKTRHTVDLELRGGHVLVGQGGGSETATQRVPLDAIGVPLRFSQRLAAFIASSKDPAQGSPDFAIVECQLVFSGDDIELEFLCSRQDKAHPNTIRTLLSTITNLRENIQIEELCSRARYGGRQKHHETDGSVPKPVCCEPATQGAAELANVALADVLHAQHLLLAT